MKLTTEGRERIKAKQERKKRKREKEKKAIQEKRGEESKRRRRKKKGKGVLTCVLTEAWAKRNSPSAFSCRKTQPAALEARMHWKTALRGKKT